MAVRSIFRSTTDRLRTFTAQAMDILFDSANQDLLTYKDSGGVNRVVVDQTSIQVLSNKAIDNPVALYATDGAIDSTISHQAVLTKGSAGAYTIAAPTRDGIEIKIAAGTSFAHVITGTNLFWAGETGGPFNKFTTAAFIGSGGILVSYNGLWLCIADQIATIGD